MQLWELEKLKYLQNWRCEARSFLFSGATFFIFELMPFQFGHQFLEKIIQLFSQCVFECYEERTRLFSLRNFFHLLWIDCKLIRKSIYALTWNISGPFYPIRPCQTLKFAQPNKEESGFGRIANSQVVQKLQAFS